MPVRSRSRQIRNAASDQGLKRRVSLDLVCGTPAVFVEPCLVPGAYLGGLPRVGNAEFEPHVSHAERARDDASYPCRNPTRFRVGVPVADLPGDLDDVTGLRGWCGPACAAATGRDVEADRMGPACPSRFARAWGRYRPLPGGTAAQAPAPIPAAERVDS